jgi:cell filamentation protein
VANYTYPGTDTVKNRFGATNHDELERLEGSFVEARATEIALGHGRKGQFDADHLRAIHRHLFQDVYEWAGHTRDERVPLSDGTIASEPVMHKPGGADFLIGRFIPDALDGFAKKLRDADYLRGLSRGHFAARAADIMAFLNAIHPFREGNGRTQRIFLQELAQDAGHGLDFSTRG